MQRNFTKTEQQTARGVSLFAFLSDLDPYRFSVSEKGYLLDAENPDWVGDIKKNWWYNNNRNASHKNGNTIDWLMYVSGEQYTFPEAMNILLAYADGDNWRQYLRNNKPDNFVPVDSYDYGNDLPFN